MNLKNSLNHLMVFKFIEPFNGLEFQYRSRNFVNEFNKFC